MGNEKGKVGLANNLVFRYKRSRLNIERTRVKLFEIRQISGRAKTLMKKLGWRKKDSLRYSTIKGNVALDLTRLDQKHAH